MKTFRTFPFIEKPPSLFGISLIDLVLVLGLFIALLLLGGVFFVLGWNIPQFFGFDFFLSMVILIFLRINNKNKQPHYLLSLFAFYFLQKKQFYIENGQIPIKFI